MPVSGESRFIGYIVLGFGVLAVIAVGVLAFSGREDLSVPAGTQAPVPAANALKKAASNTARDMEADLRDKAPTISVEKIERKDLYFKRQPNIAAASVEGSWQSRIGKKTVVLKMSGGTFQIVISPDGQQNLRIYSSGTYKKTEDILVFTPDKKWTPPAVPQGQPLYYQPLTQAVFPVIAALESGKMLWQNPPPQEKRVYAPASMVLIGPQDQPYVVWQKM